MEKKLKEYEKFIAKETKKKMGEKERLKLLKFHNSMMMNFQHERLIHLIVTLFFAFFAVLFLLATMWVTLQYGLASEIVPLYLVSLILAVLTGFYIKHYYFLENHIQGLYKYNKIIASV